VKNDTSYLVHAITQFEKTLENDNECASAYAQLARIYYYLDFEMDTRFSISGDEKTFSKQINKYADKALFYDNESDLSLLSKALYYRNEDEFEMAITYLEKALEYNPNSIAVIQLLNGIYYYDLRDLEKSIEFALLSMKFNVLLDNNFSVENLETSYSILGTIFRSLGFFEEALFYVNKSLEINPNSAQANITRTEILVDLDNNYQRSKEIYLDLIQRGIISLEIKRLLAVSCYKMRDWESALKYYQELFKDLDHQNMDYNGYASGRLAVIYSKLGDAENSVEHINKYLDYIETIKNQQHIGYKEIIGAYSINNESEKALEQLKKLSRLKTNYATIRNFKDDPIFDNIREHPEFNKLVSEIETKFWKNHERIKKSLEERGLLNLNL
ncbi:MAG: tetratricopeptide repeat protein, partial [Bacteroidetes bacterium]